MTATPEQKVIVLDLRLTAESANWIQNFQTFQQKYPSRVSREWRMMSISHHVKKAMKDGDFQRMLNIWSMTSVPSDDSNSLANLASASVVDATVAHTIQEDSILQPLLSQILKIATSDAGTIAVPPIVEQLCHWGSTSEIIGSATNQESELVIEVLKKLNVILAGTNEFDPPITDDLAEAVEYFIEPIKDESPRSVFRQAFLRIGEHKQTKEKVFAQLVERLKGGCLNHKISKDYIGKIKVHVTQQTDSDTGIRDLKDLIHAVVHRFPSHKTDTMMKGIIADAQKLVDAATQRALGLVAQAFKVNTLVGAKELISKYSDVLCGFTSFLNAIHQAKEASMAVASLPWSSSKEASFSKPTYLTYLTDRNLLAQLTWPTMPYLPNLTYHGPFT